MSNDFHKERIEFVKKTIKREFDLLFYKLPVELSIQLQGKLYVAGGCIYSLYNNTEPNDYDIFITDEKTVEYVRDFFHKQRDSYDRNGILFGSVGDLDFVMTKYAITIDNKFQIVTKFHGKPSVVVSEFDFKHNMAYYIPHLNKLAFGKFCGRKYMESKKLVFNENRSRDLSSTIMRIPKFIKRGMTIEKKEIAKILYQLKDIINTDREKEIITDYLFTDNGGY